MVEYDFMLRSVAYIVIGFILVLSRIMIGRGVDNIPFWSGIFLTFLYGCYAFSGIKFANGPSAVAELLFASFMAMSTLFFIVGMWCARYTTNKKRVHIVKNYLPRIYLLVLFLISIGFYIHLTQGQPWRLLTDTVGLKVERLDGIAGKDPILLNFDALVQAMTLVAFVWAVIGYSDDKRSRSQLIFTTGLLLLYVLSTGSRSPLLGFFALALAALAEARKHSPHMAWLAGKKWYFIAISIVMLIFFIGVTALRIELEALDKDLFLWYFGVADFGIVNGLLEQPSASSFLASTIIVYAASTFNNFIIRFQELSNIIPTMGYRFAFFYVSAIQQFIPGLFSQEVAAWRDLAITNNLHLAMISDAAGQWTTPYGDLLWDFGIFGAMIITGLVSGMAGYIVEKARRKPDFHNLLLKVVFVGFSIVPLVNPLLSLYVHYALFIVISVIVKNGLLVKSNSRIIRT